MLFISDTTHIVPLTRTNTLLPHTVDIFYLSLNTHTLTQKYTRLNTTSQLFHYILLHTPFSPNTEIKNCFLKIRLSYCVIFQFTAGIQLVIKQI